MPGTQRLRILGDDGGVLRDGVACKRLPAARQGFRSVTVARSQGGLTHQHRAADIEHRAGRAADGRSGVRARA